METIGDPFRQIGSVAGVTGDPYTEIQLARGRFGMSKGKPGTVTRLLRRASAALVLALALIPALTQAVVRDYYFRTLDSRQGLLQNTVTALFQDREGFVWVATQGALHRFDGYRFVTLETLVGQENVLPSFAQALAEDGRGVLYVGTLRDGLFAVDAARRKVTPIALAPVQGSPAAGQIDVLLYQSGVGLWVARADGIGLVPEGSGQYRRILAFEPVPITVATTGITRTVNAMALDGEGQLWIAAGHGIYRITADQGRAERYSVEGARALLLDGTGTLWIGSPSGLRRKPAGSDLAEVVWPHSPRPADGSCCEVIALAQSADGTLWLSVNGGNLWHMDPDTRDAVPIPVNPWVQGMLTEVGLPRLMIDRSDLLWVGSHVRGVVTTPAAATAFRAVFDMDPARDPLTGNVVRSLIEGDDGSLWLGTQGGLRRYEPLRDAFESFDAAFVPPAGAGARLVGPTVVGIARGSDGGYWLVTNLGLFHFDPRSARAVAVEPLEGGTGTPMRAIERGRDGALWLGYGDLGLLRFEPATGKAQLFEPRPGVEGAQSQARVLSLREDSRGRLWIGGMAGLAMRDPETGTFRNFVPDPARTDALSGSIVRTIHETRDGTVWVGSHRGLDQVLEAADGSIRFRHWPLSSREGPTVVYALAEDGDGKLWISGNDGLQRLDRSDGSTMKFGLSAGLQDLEFNGGAAVRLRDGQIAFGGIRGLNLIDPSRVHPSAFDPPVVLSWFGSGRRAMTGPFSRGLPVVVSQQDQVLSLGFSALDYASPETNLYSYRLDGFDDDFSLPSSRPMAVYTNLPAGQYTFRVRGSNRDGLWSSAELSLPVTVTPPWWRSSWAWAVYALLAMALIGVIWRRHRQRMATQADLIAQIREREERLKVSLWGAGDSYWDWDLRANKLHRIGADLVLHVPLEERITTDEWRQNAIHPDDLPRVHKLMYDHLAGKTDSFESEHRIRNAYNEWTWVRSRGKVVERDAESNPVRVAGTAHDITSVRQAERERRIASEVLRSMNEAVAVVDLNFRFVSVNPAFSRITGYSEQDVIGMPDSLLESGQHAPEFYRLAHESLTGAGHFRGEMWLRRADGEEFLGWVEQTEVCDELGARSHFVSVVSDITDKKRAEQELRYLANYDTLTGLPNRSLLIERLSRAVVRARRQRSAVAVLFLDLDHFKIINDSLGHAAGDRILKASAARLLGVVGSSDTVARLGGDEFTIVMEDANDRDAVIGMAEAVLAAFGEPILTEGHGDIVITPSIGIAMFPDHGQVPTDLLKFADAAMYRAKERGRNTFQFYDQAMDTEVRRRATLTAALRRALDREELYLEFQPRQSLFDGRISGVEALLRWDSEEFGMISPATFIPLAEESGLILPIGEWVLAEACHRLCEWRDQGLLDLNVAVNVSVLQLMRGNLAASVSRALEESGLPANRLELELTESVVMANAEQTITLLRDLKRIGVTIAVDDFGTGYSSLIYLKRLPIDTLKIDKEFVGDLTRDPDDAAITSTIITMAHSLGLTVIAEGVETPEQLRYLRSQGCDEIQGFLLARPMEADACLEFLRRYARSTRSVPAG